MSVPDGVFIYRDQVAVLLAASLWFTTAEAAAARQVDQFTLHVRIRFGEDPEMLPFRAIL